VALSQREKRAADVERGSGAASPKTSLPKAGISSWLPFDGNR